MCLLDTSLGDVVRIILSSRMINKNSGGTSNEKILNCSDDITGVVWLYFK